MKNSPKEKRIIPVYAKFDKSKKKDKYKLLDITQRDRFRIVTFQVDLPEEERQMLNHKLAKKAFSKH